MSSKEDRSLLRIIDANLNRLSEALRVAEDVCRFHWNLEGFSRELKALRHDMLEGLLSSEAARQALLDSRDIEGDPGREAPSGLPPEANAESMAFRNIERAKEAIRVLEEACRAARPDVVGLLARGRYHLYSIEKGIGRLAAAGDLPARLQAASLCLLATGALTARPVLEAVEQALAAGVRMVQLREKELPDRELLRQARALRELTARHDALLVINDRPDVALLCGADGVHVGQDDLPLGAVRTLVGEKILVGVSTHSADQARKAAREGADYVGVGPVFQTSTKDAGPPLGPAGLSAILKELSIPAFAIGGITAEKAHELARAGCRRWAVSSGILSAEDVPAGVHAYLDALRA